MSMNRRELLSGAAALSTAAMLPQAAMAADTIQLGSILDTSGIFDAYGKPMDQAMRLAVKEINDAGGLLGNRSKLPPMIPNLTWRFIRNMRSN
jgi:urea transport system substrate-binding protein